MSALGESIWDDYRNNPYSGAALDAAKSASTGHRRTVATSGNQAWRDAQSGNQQQTPQSYFPSVASSQFGPAQMTSAMMYPAYQALGQSVQQNQIPVGGVANMFGFGYGSSQQPDNGNFLNQEAAQPRQPTMTGYHWYKGTGGVSGGNDAGMNVFYDNGTSQWVNTRTPGQFPAAAQTTQQAQQSLLDTATANAKAYGGGGILPSWNSPTGSQVDLTGLGPRTPNISDPSVGGNAWVSLGRRPTDPSQITRTGNSTSSSNTGRSFSEILDQQDNINNMIGEYFPNIYVQNKASIQAVRDARSRDLPTYASDKLSFL